MLRFTIFLGRTTVVVGCSACSRIERAARKGVQDAGEAYVLGEARDVMVQPVGLPGEATTRARVRSSQAASTPGEVERPDADSRSRGICRP
jgi:hypothetical protein